MDAVSQVQITTPASNLYQRDLQGGKLPPEFPPEPDESYPGKKPEGSKGQSVDVTG